MLKSKTPWNYGNDDRVVRLSSLAEMPELQEQINNWHEDQVYDVAIEKPELGIKARKLLDSSTVPVGAFKVCRFDFLTEDCKMSCTGFDRQKNTSFKDLIHSDVYYV